MTGPEEAAARPEEEVGPIGSPILTSNTEGPWSRWCKFFITCEQSCILHALGYAAFIIVLYVRDSFSLSTAPFIQTPVFLLHHFFPPDRYTFSSLRFRAELLASRKANPSAKWLSELPYKARKLEEALYRTAPSLEAYMDGRTVKARLKVVASAITNRFRHARRRSSAVSMGSTSASVMSMPTSGNGGGGGGGTSRSQSNSSSMPPPSNQQVKGSARRARSLNDGGSSSISPVAVGSSGGMGSLNSAQARYSAAAAQSAGVANSTPNISPSLASLGGGNLNRPNSTGAAAAAGTIVSGSDWSRHNTQGNGSGNDNLSRKATPAGGNQGNVPTGQAQRAMSVPVQAPNMVSSMPINGSSSGGGMQQLPSQPAHGGVTRQMSAPPARPSSTSSSSSTNPKSVDELQKQILENIKMQQQLLIGMKRNSGLDGSSASNSAPNSSNAGSNIMNGNSSMNAFAGGNSNANMKSMAGTMGVGPPPSAHHLHCPILP